MLHVVSSPTFIHVQRAPLRERDLFAPTAFQSHFNQILFAQPFFFFFLRLF